MLARTRTSFLATFAFACGLLFSGRVLAQREAPNFGIGHAIENVGSLEVYLQDSNGEPLNHAAVVTLIKVNGQLLREAVSKGGHVHIDDVPPTEYSMRVVAAGYTTVTKRVEVRGSADVKVTIQMEAASEGIDAISEQEIALLGPKAQKALEKAIEALRTNKPADARGPLEKAYQLAPKSAEVQFLYGAYEVRNGNPEEAKSHWTKALEANSQHYRTLISLSEALLHENKPAEAMPYLERAAKSEPAAWRPHALYAEAYLKQGMAAEAIQQAEQAQELGSGKAAAVQPVLAAALFNQGQVERATTILEGYVKGHPNDTQAKKELFAFQTGAKEAGSVGAGATDSATVGGEFLDDLPSSWTPARGKESTSEGQMGAPPLRVQKALDKASNLMGPNMSKTATEMVRGYLETAYKIAPTNPDVNYLFGVYSWHMDDRARAKSYWTRAIEFEPTHYRTLVSLGQALVDENKPGEALPYVERATQVEPFSWRPYVLCAHAHLRQGSSEQAAKEAERALELGHEEAAVGKRYLAAALAKLGDMKKAVSVLQSYVSNHHSDISANKQLEDLSVAAGQNMQEAAEKSSQELLLSAAIVDVTPLPLPLIRWLPPDVDDAVPTVEPDTPCALDDVLQRAEKRVQEFVQNVNRYTASEFLKHQSIDEWGFATAPETRKFNYVVGIEEYKQGYFDVKEYRAGLRSLQEFPGGVATNGLPALALVLHPSNVGNFEMSCEGLGRLNGQRVWQIHFRQRPDKPNTMRDYRVGENGPSYPVALKGRIWIAPENYQIVRLETDLVKPILEIRLVNDHTLVEYGPVRFRDRAVEMWLPQTAEVYSEWKGLRFHRTHSFSNYLLFSVDEKQNISAPKATAEAAPKKEGESERPKP